MFGTKAEVDPGLHRIGAAAGWGGLPEREAYYISQEPHLPVGAYRITAKDVPVDAFWSVTVYGADSFLHKNDLGAYSVNNISGVKNPDGSVTINLGGDGSLPNSLPLTQGWNYTVRMYRPPRSTLPTADTRVCGAFLGDPPVLGNICGAAGNRRRPPKSGAGSVLIPQPHTIIAGRLHAAPLA